MKITRFNDVPKFIRASGYSVDHELRYLKDAVDGYIRDGLNMNPDFQRGYVWTEKQKVAFVEYVLRGGMSGLDIYFNCKGWNHKEPGDTDEYGKFTDFVIVDGKQRLSAMIGFVVGEFRVFGSFYGEYTDSPRLTQSRLKFHVNDLRTRKEVLQWYLEMNTGGTVHTDEEIEKVKALIAEEP